MLKEIYHGQIRDGKVGSLTAEKYRVYYDPEKDYAFLDPFPIIEYVSDDYRKSVNDSNEIGQYFQLHDTLNFDYFQLIKGLVKREDIVLDLGCGGGSLLDMVHGVCAKTIAIEPNIGFHDSLRARGHEVFNSFEACLSKYANSIDFVMSNHVIEHVESPEDFIANIAQLLKTDGKGYVQTPNYNDILLKLDFAAFAPFFFRKVHNLYLTANSLEKIVRAQNLNFVEAIYFHEFGMANALHWLRDKAPKGHNRLEGISPLADDLWKSFLVSTGQTKDFVIVFGK